MRPRIQQVPFNLEEDSCSLLMLQVEQTRNVFSSKEVFHIHGNHENDDNNILVIDGTKPLLACSLGTLKQWLKQASQRPFPKEPRYRQDQWNTLRAAYVVYWWNYFKPTINWEATPIGKSLVGLFGIESSQEIWENRALEEIMILGEKQEALENRLAKIKIDYAAACNKLLNSTQEEVLDNGASTSHSTVPG